MSKEDIKREDLSISVMVLCIIGVVLTVFGFFVLKNDGFKLKVISTKGTVTGVTVSRNSEGEIEQRSVNLSYVANNGSYNATISNYNDEINIGETMTLYYDFLSPASVDNKRSGYIGYISVIVGIILAIKTGPRFARIIKDNYLWVIKRKLYIFFY